MKISRRRGIVAVQAISCPVAERLIMDIWYGGDMVMWLFGERRHHERRAVDLRASLRCSFSDIGQTIPVSMCDVSRSGAQLCLERRQMGRYHLFIDNQAAAFELSVPFRDELVKTRVEICWYRWDDDKRYLHAGVKILGRENGNAAFWERVAEELERRYAPAVHDALRTAYGRA